MNNTVGNVLNFFADKNNSLNARVGTIIISITLLFLIDLVGGFSYNFQTNNKLNQLEKINKLKITYQNDPSKLIPIKATEDQIINKRHYSEVVSSWFGSDTQLTIENIKKPNNANATNSILDINLMILSSSYGLIVLLIFSFLSIFFKNSQVKSNSDYTIGLIGATIMIAIIIAVVTIISYQIPIIDEDKPFWNYLINAVIHALFVIAVAAFFNPNRTQKYLDMNLKWGFNIYQKKDY